MPKKPVGILPKEKRATFTVQLDRIGDESFREWLDDELYLGKKAGRIPKEWGISPLVKAMLRGEYVPIHPAPRAQSPDAAPTEKPARKRKPAT